MEIIMDAIEVRVLGSLIEKELATPEYYPLTLNALTSACNQKSNRDPIVAYDESVVASALDRLIERKLVWKSSVGRVPKFEERLTHEHSLVPRESSVLCVLLLRGPQTVGEIRGRTVRIYNFKDLEDVQATLDNLAQWGFVRQQPRLPGHKESRYGHLLCTEKGEPETAAPAGGDTTEEVDDTRIERIEDALERLQKEIEDLKTAFQAFKGQFD